MLFRSAGTSHYPFLKMLGFAADGITSLSIKPIRLITLFGAVVSLFSFLMGVWSLVSWMRGAVVRGWTSEIICVCFLGGIQLLSLGVIGEYIGKIYLEVKRRPCAVISDRTWENAGTVPENYESMRGQSPKFTTASGSGRRRDTSSSGRTAPS